MNVAFIADVHSNLPALEAVLKEVEGMRIFCCGDLVGYGPHPNEVVELIKEHEISCVLGNHDYAVISGNTSDFNWTAASAVEWTRKELQAENMMFLESLPRFIIENGFFMVHGSPRNPLNEYVFPEHPHMESYLDYVKQDTLVLGHTHCQMMKEFEGGLILNPGAVGQPRDGNPHASYALYDTVEKKASLRRVEYNIKEVADEIIEVGLPKTLAVRLYDGW